MSSTSRALLLSLWALLVSLCALPGLTQVAMAQNRTTTVEGIVFDDANGDGRRASGENGLPGMRVAPLDGVSGKLLYNDAGAMVLITTDERGLWRYQAPGNLDLRFRLWSLDGWLEATPAEWRVSVASGDTRSRVDFGYQPTLATTIEGSVFDDRDGDGRRDTDESGRSDVRVVVLDGPTGQILRTPAGAMIETRTDAGGRFRYRGSGSQDLRFRPSELATTPAERRVQAANGSTTGGVDFGYAQPSPTAVEGVVFDDRNRNGRRNRSDPGMPGVRIVLLDVATGQPLRTSAGAVVEVTTDATGHYRYEGTGSLDLRLRPRDLDATTSQNPEGWLDTNPAERRVQVANGSVASGADFAF